MGDGGRTGHHGATGDSAVKGGLAWALLVPLLKARRRVLLLALLAGVVETVGTVVAPAVAGRAVQQVVQGATAAELWPGLAALGLLGVLRATGVASRKWQTMKLQSGVGADLRELVYQHCQRLSFAYHDRVSPGDLLSRLASDAWLLHTFVGLVPFLLQSAVVATVAAVVLVVLQPLLAVAVILVFALFSSAALLVAARVQPVARRWQDGLSDYSRFVEQQVRGIRVVKGHGFADEGRERGSALVASVHTNALRIARMTARFWSTFLLAPAGATLVVVALGGWLGARGDLAAGEVVTFLLYLGLLVGPVGVLAQVGAQSPVCAAAAARIRGVLDAEPDVVDPAHPRALPVGAGELVFEQVHFGYRDDRPVLEGVDLRIAPGESVALVGLSGAGKTTLAQLVPRFYDPTHGRVLLDGVDLRELRLSDLRRSIGVVFQDTVVFSTTIRENIAFPEADLDEEAIRSAARRAHCHRFIDRLPEGYDTLVGESGASLSGGQRQRLAIARAILADSRILILDDATSAVDPTSDAAVREGLREVMQGRTTLMVAHRVETLSLADRVLLFDRGRVVADGTHERLLSLPAYRTALALPIAVDA